MATQRIGRIRQWSVLAAALVAGTLLVASPETSARLHPSVASGQDAAVVGEVTAAANVLSYQGLLLDTATGAPKPDGVYEIAFRLYNVESGGVPLWAEAKDLATKGGRFSTLLGTVTPLDLGHFNGQELWLALKVGTDAEAVPRQRLAFTAYAFYARNADTVDGLDSSALVRNNAAQVDNSDVADGALSPAKVAGTAWTSQNDGAGSGLDADLFDGLQAAAFAPAGHNHDTAYVNATGDVMSGNLTVPKVIYSVPRTHYLSLGSEAFRSEGDEPFVNGYGCGGAYISSAISAGMSADIHLPQGATLTRFEAFFYDNSSSDASITLGVQFLNSCGYSNIAQITTSGQADAYRSLSTSSISIPVVDNRTLSYRVRLWATPAWDPGGSLRIKGAVITYTIPEAP
jgi:hypothetical protein